MISMNTWARDVAKNVGEAVREARNRQGLTASELAEKVTAEGLEMTRAVITALETGRRSTVSVPELIILGWVLKVPPIALLFPHMPDKRFEIVPNVSMSELDAALWFSGDLPPIQVLDGSVYPYLGEQFFNLEGEDTRMREQYRSYFQKWQALNSVDQEEEPERFIKAFADLLGKYSELKASDRPVRNPLDQMNFTGGEEVTGTLEFNRALKMLSALEDALKDQVIQALKSGEGHKGS